MGLREQGGVGDRSREGGRQRRRKIRLWTGGRKGQNSVQRAKRCASLKYRVEEEGIEKLSNEAGGTKRKDPTGGMESRDNGVGCVHVQSQNSASLFLLASRSVLGSPSSPCSVPSNSRWRRAPLMPSQERPATP
jgi:hypothetical protein